MKYFYILIIIIFTGLTSGCKKKDGRFNYELIKSKLDINSKQEKVFDELTTKFTTQAKDAWLNGNGDMEAVKKAQKLIFATQDAEIKKLLSEEQFAIYFNEIKIEREGREKYNMNLIKNELKLDSAQVVKYDLANEAFFKTLYDNHDNYHGKPAVFKEYHKEINKSRKDVFNKLMTKEQFKLYETLYKQYGVGESEH